MRAESRTRWQWHITVCRLRGRRIRRRLMNTNKLRPKYLVSKMNIDGSADYSTTMKATDPDNPDSPFVLLPRKDPAAIPAMITYARYCEPELAKEIKDWLRKVVIEEASFGTQGERNFRAARLRSLQDIL